MYVRLTCKCLEVLCARCVMLCLLLQLLGQPGEKASAIPISPLVFFQPLSSFLAYHGFSEQCAQWDKSETAGSVNKISNPRMYFSTPNSLRVRQDPTLGVWWMGPLSCNYTNALKFSPLYFCFCSFLLLEMLFLPCKKGSIFNVTYLWFSLFFKQ